MENKIFQLAIILSFVLHLAVFWRFYTEKAIAELRPKIAAVQYKIDAEAPRYRQVPPETIVHRIAPAVPPGAEIVGTVPQDVSRQDTLLKAMSQSAADAFKIYERKPERIKGLRVSKEVSMPVLRSEKINSPAYVTYYQIVRDRIRDRAYTNYTRLSVGEVYLTFIIKSDGTLGELQIIDSKSTANDFLRDVGQKSVREAAPFPPFPRDLNYPELTFNVAISFQYHEE